MDFAFRACIYSPLFELTLCVLQEAGAEQDARAAAVVEGETQLYSQLIVAQAMSAALGAAEARARAAGGAPMPARTPTPRGPALRMKMDFVRVQLLRGRLEHPDVVAGLAALEGPASEDVRSVLDSAVRQIKDLEGFISGKHHQTILLGFLALNKTCAR